MKRYRDLNSELRKIFGIKVIKLSLNGGFSCPNRNDSTGCIFCSIKGSGEYAAPPELSITEQLKQQISFVSKKWPKAVYIAYFGTNTSTYADIGYLKRIFEEAISFEGVVGLAISTRPDCIDENVMDLLKELNKKTFLWIELGLQTMHEKTHELLNTRYDFDIFLDTFKRLKSNDIRTVVHMILSLPYETEDMMKQSFKTINSLSPWGIKIHMLYILEDTALKHLYDSNPFYMLSEEEYTSLVIELLGYLNEDISIHRLTGDPPRKDLLKPKWCINKRAVLQSIESKMGSLDMYQGKYI